MANFFDPNDVNDRYLLHSSVRDHDELALAVDKVEWEIIDAFTQRDSQGIATYDAFFKYESGADPFEDLKVRLVGYNADDPGDSDDGLKEAMRRTIADIVSGILRDYDNPQGVGSITQGKRSISYSGSIPSWRDWPSGWDRKLRNYDARLQNYGI